MSAAEIAQIIAIAAAAIAAGAVALVIIVFRRMQQLREDQKVILGPKGVSSDIIAYVGGLSTRIDRLRDAVETLSLEARDHEVRIDGCVSRVGMVRFDAYNDLGGRQSTAIGLLNAKDDGLVITTVVSRDFARTYVKLIKEGQSDIPLAPEEEEALEQARSRGNAPFTLRPRPAPADKEAVEQAAATPLVDSIDEERLALERENRRRRRQGLPPLDRLPSQDELGWPSLEVDEDAETEETTETRLATEPLDPERAVSPDVTGSAPDRLRDRRTRRYDEEPDPFDDL